MAHEWYSSKTGQPWCRGEPRSIEVRLGSKWKRATWRATPKGMMVAVVVAVVVVGVVAVVVVGMVAVVVVGMVAVVVLCLSRVLL